eukprot:Nk52_evm1s2174 gene=Nk52_evmTU1s2174
MEWIIRLYERLKGIYTEPLRMRNRDSIRVGEWARLQDGGDYFYKIVHEKIINGRRVVYGENADLRDPQLRGSEFDN